MADQICPCSLNDPNVQSAASEFAEEIVDSLDTAFKLEVHLLGLARAFKAVCREADVDPEAAMSQLLDA